MAGLGLSLFEITSLRCLVIETVPLKYHSVEDTKIVAGKVPSGGAPGEGGCSGIWSDQLAVCYNCRYCCVVVNDNARFCEAWPSNSRLIQKQRSCPLWNGEQVQPGYAIWSSGCTCSICCRQWSIEQRFLARVVWSLQAGYRGPLQQFSAIFLWQESTIKMVSNVKVIPVCMRKGNIVLDPRNLPLVLCAYKGSV